MSAFLAIVSTFYWLFFSQHFIKFSFQTSLLQERDPDMSAVTNLKKVVITAMLGLAAMGATFANASVTTSPEHHLLATLDYVELEAEQGDKNMQLFLGRAYLEGTNGLQADPLKGMYWLEKAAVDMPEVKTMIGDLFKAGQLVPRDNHQAVYWYTAAAKAGDVPAMVELGIYYASGVNGSVECGEAIKWFNEAANGGSLESKRNLVWLYATCDDERMRDGQRALKLAKQVLNRADTGDAADYDNLAAAYAACGEFQRAIEAQKMALGKLEDDEQDEKRYANFQQRLKLYENNQTIYSTAL